MGHRRLFSAPDRRRSRPSFVDDNEDEQVQPGICVIVAGQRLIRVSPWRAITVGGRRGGDAAVQWRRVGRIPGRPVGTAPTGGGTDAARLGQWRGNGLGPADYLLAGAGDINLWVLSQCLGVQRKNRPDRSVSIVFSLWLLLFRMSPCLREGSQQMFSIQRNC